MQQQGRMLQRVKKREGDLGRYGGTWHREKVKSRGGNCEGKRQFRGVRGKEAESIPLKKKQNQNKKGMNPYLGRLTSGAPDLEREKTEKKNRKRKKRRS